MRINWYKKSPEAYSAMRSIEHSVEESTLEPLLKELVRIRASQLNGCAFCLDMHTKDARALGESEQRIYVLPAWKESTLYSKRERAALAWCETLTLIAGKEASDALYSELETNFTKDEIVSLTLAIIAINSWNRLTIGFKQEIRNYVSEKKPINSGEGI
jgi:AhpD family alkylhydroperoxidase